MGVRTLVGTYDGTRDAAVMVDSVTGFAFGPLFQGADACEQVSAFVAWLAREPYVFRAAEIGLESRDIPDPVKYPQPNDPRVWPDDGLAKLVVFWRRQAVDSDTETLRAETGVDVDRREEP